MISDTAIAFKFLPIGSPTPPNGQVYQPDLPGGHAEPDAVVAEELIGGEACCSIAVLGGSKVVDVTIIMHHGGGKPYAMRWNEAPENLGDTEAIGNKAAPDDPQADQGMVVHECAGDKELVGLAVGRLAWQDFGEVDFGVAGGHFFCGRRRMEKGEWAR